MNKLLLTLSSLLVASVTAISAHAQDAKAGETKVAMCIGCHGIPGYKASFPEVYQVPMISGQNAKFITASLSAYKKGERKHPSMRGIADTLSDQDIADIAAYYEGHGKVDGAAPAKAAPAPSAKVAELLTKGGCVACHGANGEGMGALPPLWGPKSYSIGASMSRIERAASFIYHNMPQSAPGTLTHQEAFDLAAYINSKPRPDSPAKELDWPLGGVPADVPYDTRSGHKGYRPPPLLPRHPGHSHPPSWPQCSWKSLLVGPCCPATTPPPGSGRSGRGRLGGPDPPARARAASRGGCGYPL